MFYIFPKGCYLHLFDCIIQKFDTNVYSILTFFLNASCEGINSIQLILVYLSYDDVLWF